MDTTIFYDALSPFYHLIYADWETSIERQGRALDEIIRALRGAQPQTVLDAACGVGTQSLGLAQLGYQVTASELSPKAIERARQEALRRGLRLDFAVADMRMLAEHHRRTRTPATPQTIYRIGSITKLFTSTAIMQLRDRGALRLDDPVQQHLPWFTIQSGYGDAPTITVRHLLTHTSGLPHEAPFPYWTDDDFPTSEQIRTHLPQQEAAIAPETRWMYSNLAFVLAGEIVSAASGEPYPEYIQVLVEHGGSVLGYATWRSISPHEKIAVIVLTNATDGQPSLYGDQALTLFAPAIIKAVTPTPPILEPDPAWQTYVGQYRNRWGDLQVLVWNGTLALISRMDPDPQRSMAMPVPQGEHTFKLMSHDGFLGWGVPVVFELGPDGRVTGLKLGENYMDPIG